MGKYDELVGRLCRWTIETPDFCPEWICRNPDGPEAATAITTLEAELAAAQQQVKGALVMHDALSEKLENTQAELAAMKARGDRLAEALELSNGALSTEARQALTEWRDQ